MMPADARLHDPAWFPDRIDPANRLIRLVRTTRAIVAGSAFLDGRTPLADGGSPDWILDLDAFAAGLAAPRPPIRWLFHGSFCGSTLLARVLTIDGIALCLREPQVLVDLANWHAALRPDEVGLFDAVLRATLAKLSQRWAPGEVVAIKPSNWINAALPAFWSPDDRIVLVDSRVEDFLVAMLRGGRDRMAYSLQLYRQFATAWPMLARHVDAVAGDTGDGIANAVLLIAALHRLQDGVVEACRRVRADGSAPLRLTYPDWLADAPASVAAANAALSLGAPATTLAASLARRRPTHAKDPRATVSADDEDAANRSVRAHHAAAIDAGLALARALDAQDLAARLVAEFRRGVRPTE